MLLQSVDISSFSEYEPEERADWCADHIDWENICDGLKDDCVEKGQAKCNHDDQCVGIMYNVHWSPHFKGVRMCTSRRMVKKGDWFTYLKKVPESRSGKYSQTCQMK